MPPGISISRSASSACLAGTVHSFRLPVEVSTRLRWEVGATPAPVPCRSSPGLLGERACPFRSTHGGAGGGRDAPVPRLVRIPYLSLDPVLKAALAHFWFVTIHPFEDGNGRIARAITDMALARAEGSPQRFYSMSSQICRERHDYYDLLEESQKASLDITRWMLWFVGCFDRAVDSAEETLAAVLAKARLWQRAQGVSMNDRQRLVVNRMLDGWKGKLTVSVCPVGALLPRHRAARPDHTDAAGAVAPRAGGRPQHRLRTGLSPAAAILSR